MSSPTPTSMPALDLRCREAEWIDRPQTLAEFGRPAAVSARRRYTGLAEVLVADAIARGHLEIDELAGGRVILSCETPRYGIPLGVRDLERPPIEDWQLREQLCGDLLDAGTDGRLERSLAMQVRRGLIAVAGALPLLASPMLAHASGPAPMLAYASGPTVLPGVGLEQLAAFAPPKLPKDAQPEPKAEAPAQGPAAPAEPASTAAPPTAAPPAATPPTAAPPPRVANDSLTLTGTNVWDGLLGKQVKLEMKNGETVAGTIVAQSLGDLALARASDGMVVAVPKSEVVGVRLRPDSAASAGGSTVPINDRPLQDGRGLHGGGIVMVTLGSIAALSGTVMLALSPYYLFISLPLLLPGLAMIGGGSAMLAAGGKKRKAFNKAWGIPQTARMQVTPTLGAGRGGGQAGLVLRF